MKDNYIQHIAKMLRSKFNENDLPEDGLDYLFNLYAVLTLVKGDQTTPEDVHNAWSAWASEFDPSNDSIVRFEQLAADVQDSDIKFAEVIKLISIELGSKL